jgi:hypothetical protein
MTGLFDIPPPPPRDDEGPGAPQPHARRTDPETSHEAARAIAPAADTIRAEVERWARGRGAEGFIDEELSAAYDAAESSSYRTRRAELTQAGIIVDSRRRRDNSNMRKCIVWVHRDCSGWTPEPDRPMSLRERLLRHANRLDASAEGMTKEGRVAFAGELHETAALIREALAKNDESTRGQPKAPPAREKSTG